MNGMVLEHLYMQLGLGEAYEYRRESGYKLVST
jgi:hypothetical protein